jgi:tRNA threonylcarbamoyladenosine biosynthesis protein TsaE
VRQIARSEQDTEELGARLAHAQPGGREFAVVFLTGELGAGKTTLVRGFLRAQGITAAVRSPTYTLLELYRLGELTVLHADLYRVRDPGELAELGLREWAQEGYLWLIEWPERGGGHLPPPDLTLSFSVLSDAHAIELQAHSAFAEHWMRELTPLESSYRRAP